MAGPFSDLTYWCSGILPPATYPHWEDLREKRQRCNLRTNTELWLEHNMAKNSAMGEKSASFHLMSSECAKMLYLQLFPLELRLRGTDVQTQIGQIGEGQSVKCQGSGASIYNNLCMGECSDYRYVHFGSIQFLSFFVSLCVWEEEGKEGKEGGRERGGRCELNEVIEFC